MFSETFLETIKACTDLLYPNPSHVFNDIYRERNHKINPDPIHTEHISNSVVLRMITVCCCANAYK